MDCFSLEPVAFALREIQVDQLAAVRSFRLEAVCLRFPACLQNLWKRNTLRLGRVPPRKTKTQILEMFTGKLLSHRVDNAALMPQSSFTVNWTEVPKKLVKSGQVRPAGLQSITAGPNWFGVY